MQAIPSAVLRVVVLGGGYAGVQILKGLEMIQSFLLLFLAHCKSSTNSDTRRAGEEARSCAHTG